MASTAPIIRQIKSLNTLLYTFPIENLIEM